MTDKPVLFSAPMTRALLARRKSMTRRILKPQPPEGSEFSGIHHAGGEPDSWFFNSPRGPLKARVRYETGDRLWVRETFSYRQYDIPRTGIPVWYCADGDPIEGKWTMPRSSIHMPRWASRLTLAVTDVRVQRLQDIDEDDALAEGSPRLAFCEDDGKFYETGGGTHRCGFAGIWASLYGPSAWEANPWVVALTFDVLTQNIDEATLGEPN